MKCKICDINNGEIYYSLSNSEVFKCSQCKFHYSNYLDNETTLSESDSKPNLSDELRNYLRHQLQNNEGRFENHVEVSRKYLKRNEAPKILDVGIGGGLYLSKLKKIKKLNCYGIELDKNRLQFAKEEYKLNHIYPYPIQSEFWIDDHENSFDLITLWDVIEHVNSPKIIFDSASKLLKENGIFIMDTPCRNTFYHKFGEFTYNITLGKFPSFLNIMYSNHPFGHKQIFSKRDIKTLCEGYNFNLIELRIFHELSFPTKYYLKKIFKNGAIVNLLDPVVTTLMRILQIKNKMLIVAKKRTK